MIDQLFVCRLLDDHCDKGFGICCLKKYNIVTTRRISCKQVSYLMLLLFFNLCVYYGILFYYFNCFDILLFIFPTYYCFCSYCVFVLIFLRLLLIVSGYIINVSSILDMFVVLFLLRL